MAGWLVGRLGLIGWLFGVRCLVGLLGLVGRVGLAGCGEPGSVESSAGRLVRAGSLDLAGPGRLIGRLAGWG